MLALNFKSEDYVFVYCRDQAIGAIRVGAVKPGRLRSRVTLLFAGAERDFQIMRPNAVIGRYGRKELERLVDQFALMGRRDTRDWASRDTPEMSAAGT